MPARSQSDYAKRVRFRKQPEPALAMLQVVCTSFNEMLEPFQDDPHSNR
jgi:hypothetical protein